MKHSSPSTRHTPLITYILLTLASVFWGVSFILTKELFLTEEHMTVTILIAMRLAMATVVMVPLLALMRKLQTLRRGDLKWFLLLTLCEPFIYHLCETSGVQLVSGSLASVVIATIPLFVPFGVWAAYQKRPGAAVVVGVALSLIGVGVMLIGGEGLTGNLKGMLFLSGSVFIAVVYTLLLVKIVDRYNPLVITTWQNLFGLLYFTPLVLAFDAPQLVQLSWSPRMLLLILVLGICCSTLAYACYNHGVHRLGASEASIFNNTIPIFSLIAAIAIGQESFSWMKMLGIVIVIAGVVISQRPAKPPKAALVAMAALLLTGCSEPKRYGPVPTEEQLAWQRMEINMFCHFGPNTFTGAEWGSGEEAESVFAPTALDCSQWVDVAQQAGMEGIILTAKHHDGFCLWPSKQSTHTVADSLDVLRQFVDACHGKVKAGVYISPWDRNHPTYGTDAYNDVFVNTLREVHNNYGPFFEQWFDGACGEGPNGKKQHYDWPRFMQTMHDIAPQAIIFSDIGPGCRWVGNEEGHCGDPCWSTLNTEGATPSDNKPAPSELETGHQFSILNSQFSTLKWVPAEVDVSIRPGWFWHANEHPKTVDELMEIYYNSVGRNGLLLLNVPPDTRGRIPAQDSAVLVAFRAERDRIFSKDMAQGAKFRTLETLPYCLSLPGHGRENVLDTAYNTYWAALNKKAQIDIVFDSFTTFDIIVIQEYIPLGQRIYDVQLAINEGDGMYAQTTIDHPLCTTVGYKRIIRLDEVLGYPVRTDRIILTFRADAPPVINRIALYNSKAQ